MSLEYSGDVVMVVREATHESSEWANECTKTFCNITRAKNKATGESVVQYTAIETKPDGTKRTLMFGASGPEARGHFRRVINSLNYPINGYNGE
jgi:hypothetical protein